MWEVKKANEKQKGEKEKNVRKRKEKGEVMGDTPSPHVLLKRQENKKQKRGKNERKNKALFATRKWGKEREGEGRRSSSKLLSRKSSN